MFTAENRLILVKKESEFTISNTFSGRLIKTLSINDSLFNKNITSWNKEYYE